MVIREQSIAIDTFERFLSLPENNGRLFELIEGEVVEKTPTEEHRMLVSRLIIEIGLYLRENPIGRLGTEVRYGLPEDRSNVRLPDISLRIVNPSEPVIRRGAVPQMPDLAVEVQSPDDDLKKMTEKADYYLANGTKMVWLVYPSKKLVELITPTHRELLSGQDLLTGGDLLPGFSIPISVVFEGI